MLAGGSTLGPYKILAPLGAGGMGEVYRAHDSRLGRDVAIKVLSPHLAATPEVRARFEREARTVSQLSHPHICTLYDIGHQDGVDYLVMELLEGETLAHRLEKGPLPVAEALSLGTQIAEALDRAHRAGVVHRDLKPGNVMLTKAGAKLMDFGLARVAGLAGTPSGLSESPTVSRPLTAEGMIVGTFQYMAPEQLEGREADTRADLWALGCVLYEMATGQRAFEGASQASLIAAILKEEPRSMTELRPVTPPGLERVVRRCLQKDPDARFQSASDLAFALKGAGESSSSGAAKRVEAAPTRRGSRSLAVPLAIALVVLLAAAGAWLARERWLPRPRLRQVQLTDQSWEIPITNAALSPDGRTLLCDDWRGLHLTDPATKETRDIPLPEPLRGQIIAYSWRADGRSFVIGPNLGNARAGLWEISVLSGKATQMRAAGSWPRVSPDGQSVAFIDKGDWAAAELWVMDAAGAGAHKLAEVANFFEMGWSPEGRWLAVVEGVVPGLTILDVQRGSRSRVLEDERFAGPWGLGPGIAWMEPRRLAVSMQDSAAQAKARGLYELRLDPRMTRLVGKRRRLADWREGMVNSFTLTSDRSRLALLRGWLQMDVYWADVAPGSVRLGELMRLTLDNGDKVPVGWAPRGDGVFFESGGRSYRQSLDSPTAELVDDRYLPLATRWDGRSWLYELRMSGQGVRRSVQLVRAPIGGGAAVVLKGWRPTAHADSVGWSVGFDLPPVAGVAGAAWEWLDSTLVISRLEPRTGAMSEIMRLDRSPSFARGALSRDGGRLALCRNSATITLVDLRERRAQLLRPKPVGGGIPADSLAVQSAVWEAGGDALLVGMFSPGGLWRVELNGRATRLYAGRDFNNPWIGFLQLSPDGRRLAFARFTMQTNAWLVEGLK